MAVSLFDDEDPYDAEVQRRRREAEAAANAAGTTSPALNITTATNDPPGGPLPVNTPINQGDPGRNGNDFLLPPNSPGGVGNDPYGGYGHQGNEAEPGYTPYAPVDAGSVERRARELAERLGNEYGERNIFDPSDAAGILRNYYNSGPNGGEGGAGAIERGFANLEAQYRRGLSSQQTGSQPDQQSFQGMSQSDPRRLAVYGNQGGGNALSQMITQAQQGWNGSAPQGWDRSAPPPPQGNSSTWNGQPGVAPPPVQFDDPYTKLYEDVARQQLERLTGQNAEMDRLMKFIGDQFGELSNSQGYSADENAILRTQALEPIERDRTALNQRVLERTAARGMAPTSGLMEMDLRDVDRDAETRRTVAQRDLAINGINKRQADRQQALSLAQLGLNVPNQQGQQAMTVANSLYQLPRNALQDSLSVINASSPNGAIAALQGQQDFANQQAQQQYQQQQVQQQQTQQMWLQIGNIIAGLF